ncbi:hypothetical protein GOEFS_115_00190 [Gordonia effusa NBRC 100432]|uniref:Mce-associated membrane protein n=1 Tax=Gordonia effusa NBRC 100432 TaxID=1077974 RepID=H0R5M8_9ACTN|nr:hypothetical protein [Gordonia effusa]GAB20379.1 hypothetical protein GOEFS_115_00190 [Gordonia effusa NBRC 100432]
MSDKTPEQTDHTAQDPTAVDTPEDISVETDPVLGADEQSAGVTKSAAVGSKRSSGAARKAPNRPSPRPVVSKAPRQVSLSIRSIVVTAVIVLLVAALGLFVYRDLSARDDLNDLRASVADREHAEDVAGQYAVNAATLDYRDLTPWIANMKKGVSPDLQKQYDLIGQTMEQVLTPLRMQTSANLIVAKTVNVAKDVFRVQAVVDVNTKTIQTPNGGNTTATYTLTLDRSKDWMITSVGDPTSAIPQALGGATPTPSATPTQPPTTPTTPTTPPPSAPAGG